MKSVNQRLHERDGEICRLVRQNRALRKNLLKLQKQAKDCAQDDEGVVEDGDNDEDGDKNNTNDPTTEHGSSSDDTVSSSFFGARRSVRYTSKRTSGTFRDYMRSRAMNIDDPALENDINSEEYINSINSKNLIYIRTMERMHGVKVKANLIPSTAV
ncbi:hypothetical protein EVAR_73799_1 [Eumeta japonica]|uniref:Uncharacterized protein n=1 Tax=Eumeta variegata TaxID=151549 RepID=A0A4C1T3G7_EUMVA|nr:hypothetical protein EVAR_73799_1 [Eumeta japonica]